MKKIIAIIVILLTGIQNIQSQQIEYSSPTLKIEKLRENLFVHTSYLHIQDYGNFPCNGMIYFNDNEAIIFDTPINDTVSEELIDWITDKQKKTIKAVVINHFHSDCLGGLKVFHQHKIKSYASKFTINLAKDKNLQNLPEIGFEKRLVLQIGNKKTITEFLGEGHSRDNVISYIPSKNVLFGGCLIKELNAKKGNLKDANIEEWPKTVKRVQKKYSEADIIIPGHGKFGGQELLDYTIALFSPS